MEWDERKHPRDNLGRFTTADFQALSIDELRSILIKNSASGLVGKIDLQFFAEADMYKQQSNSLKRAIRKYRKRIIQHNDKISNPEKYISNWESLSSIEQAGIIRSWEREIRNFYNSISDRIEELKKRGDYTDD